MNRNEEQEYEIDLLELLRYFWKRLGILIAILIIGLGIGFTVSKFVLTPMYTSTSMIYIGGSGGGSVSSMLSSLQIGSALTSDYQALATSRPVVDKLIDDFNLDIEYEDMCDRIHTDTPSGTRIMSFAIDDEDPDKAKTMVDELTEMMLQQATEVMATTEPKIIQNGDIPEEPSSPNVLLNTVIAGFVALLAALVYFTFKFMTSDKINSPADVEQYLGLDNLGSIPMAPGAAKSKKNRK